MKRAVRAAAVAFLSVAVLASAALPAAASKPSWAGPPEVETVPLADDPTAPFFVCGEDVLRFSGGTVTFRFKELPDNGFLGIITLQGAEATSDDGEVFEVHGAGMFKGAEDEETGEEAGAFRLNLVFVGDDGSVERVNFLETVSNGDSTVVERGTCTLMFPEE